MTSNVLSWVMEHNPILFFKLQGEHCLQYPSIKDKNFMIVVQTKSQEQLLQQFVCRGICYDSGMIKPLWFMNDIAPLFYNAYE